MAYLYNSINSVFVKYCFKLIKNKIEFVFRIFSKSISIKIFSNKLFLFFILIFISLVMLSIFISFSTVNGKSIEFKILL